MSGEWIKVRSNLPSNPKVNGIARFLEAHEPATAVLAPGCDGTPGSVMSRVTLRSITVASLVTVWAAANEHTEDGTFHYADLKDIDDIAGIPGFGQAMASVGWAEESEDENGYPLVLLPNFTEHNTTGRSRQAERQQRYRERQKAQQSDVTRDVTVTPHARGEEKRREEGEVARAREEPTKQSSKQKQGTRLPDDWDLADYPEWRRWAQEKYPEVDPDAEAEKFRDHWHAKPGKEGRKVDWFATWRTWIRKADEFRQQRNPKPASEASKPKDLTPWVEKELREQREWMKAAGNA